MAKEGISDLEKKRKEREAEWKKQGEVTAQAINAELQEWKKVGADPQNVQFNLFQMDARMQTLMAYLGEKGYIDEVEYLELYLKPQILENLKKTREMITPMIEDARRQSIAVPALPPLPGILDQHGRPIKH